jgi:hypothetical protein
MDWEQFAAWFCGATVLIGMLFLVAAGYEERREQDEAAARQRLAHGAPTAHRNTPPQGTPPSVRLGPVQRTPFDRQGAFGGPLMRRGAPLIVRARSEPYWQEKGWRRHGAGYSGHFRIDGRQWSGSIEEPYPGGFRAFIWNPPLGELGRNTGHRPCFQNGRMDGRYEIHFHTMPASLDHAIAGVERVLGEALGVRA